MLYLVKNMKQQQQPIHCQVVKSYNNKWFANIGVGKDNVGNTVTNVFITGESNSVTSSTNASILENL